MTPKEVLIETVRTYIVGIRNPAERGSKFDRVHQQRFGAILAAFDAMEATVQHVDIPVERVDGSASSQEA